MTSFINAQTTAGGGLSFVSDASGNLQLQGGGNNGIYIGSNGNVGINSTAPVTTLDVQGNVNVLNTVIMGSSFLRNRIINGNMAIDQRNNGAAATAANNTYTYILDRWLVSPNGNNITAQRVGSIGSYSLQITGASGVSGSTILQRIESYNIADLANSVITISAVLSSSTATSVTWYTYYPNSVDNWSSATNISSGSFTITSTPTLYKITTTLSANVVNGLLVGFNFGALTSGTATVTNVQVEAGPVATPFERRLYGTELALCQRYCYACTNRPLGITLNGNALYSGIVSYPVTMRTSPALSNASCSVSSGSVGTPALQTSSGQASTLDAGIIWNTANNWNTNAAIAITAIFSAEL